MANSTKAAPANSLILIADLDGGEIPASMSGSSVASTDSCIAVGCRSDVDGDTEFTLGQIPDVDPGHPPVFQGQLRTPNLKVVFRTVAGQTILETPVARRETTVRVWTNDPSEPDQVIVGVG